MSTFLVYNGVIGSAPDHYLNGIDSRPTPTNLNAKLRIDSLSGIGAKRLREVLSITVPIANHSNLYLHWFHFFSLPYLRYLYVYVRYSLSSVFPVGVVDIIMIKYFKGLNEWLNSDQFARRLITSNATYIRNAYFSVRTLGC